MVLTKEEGILIKVLRVTVPESCWRDFLTRTGLVQHWTDWTVFCSRLTLQGLQTGSPAAAENYSLHCASVYANGDHFEHKL